MLEDGDRNKNAIVDLLTGDGRRLILIQEYLPAVREGDKRILLLDGAPPRRHQPRASRRRSSLQHPRGRRRAADHRDGRGEKAVIEAIAPRLRADGLYFVGLDMIGGKLTEVNVTSPTGIQELSRHLGRDVAADVIAWVERRADELTPGPSSVRAP